MASEKEIVAMDEKDVFAMTLRTIDSMAEYEADEDCLPYNSDKRLPPYNAVTGTETVDINGIALELAASLLDLNSATYMEGCNAQLIGLELDGYEGPINEDFSEYGKTGIMDGSTCESVKARRTLPPIILQRNVKTKDGATRIEYSYPYFLSQFTEESLGKAVQTLAQTAGTTEKSQMQKNHVSRRMAESVMYHDNGLSLEQSEKELLNIKKNMELDGTEHKKAMAVRKFYTQDRSKEEAALFDCIRKRKVNMRHNGSIIEEKFDDDVIGSLVKKVASKKNGRFALVAFWANDFAERLSGKRLGEKKKVYEPVEKPAAMKRPADEIVKILDEQRERIKRNKEMQRNSRKAKAKSTRGTR